MKGKVAHEAALKLTRALSLLNAIGGFSLKI